ncbi:MAG: TetR/AcrR family transcriptional regulator [Myxococcales bacterium]|nr:TetR/AcrR family transcriptional regulator [Myxococcales bacterium]
MSGLSIGRLAKELKMSKSGLYTHFGSKENLQLAIVELAAEMVRMELARSIEEVGEGLPRVCQLMSNWVRYVESGIFRGGCFFAAAALEFDGRPGSVKESIVELMRFCLDILEMELGLAKEQEHLQPSTNTSQLVFDLHASTQEANWFIQLMSEPRGGDWARHAIWKRLAREAAPLGQEILEDWKERFRISEEER